MRISDRYIGRQVFWGTLYAVVVLGLVLVLGNLFKEIRPLLVDQKAPLELVVRFVISVLPLSLMFTIPWGFLSAVLLVFGKLSSNQEITSFRVAGVSLVRLAMPVFVLGALFSGLSLWLNLNVVPHSKATVLQLIFDQASRDPNSLLKPGVVQGKFRDSSLKLMVEGKQDEWLEGLHIYAKQAGKDGSEDSVYIHAARAAPSVDMANGKLTLKLQDAYIEQRDPQGNIQPVFGVEAEPVVIDLKSKRDKGLKATSMTNEEILHEIDVNTDIPAAKKVSMRSEITKRYSFSMACLSFAFIAVPLGLQSRRRDTSGGLILSLLIGAGYFLITILADEFKSDTGATFVLWLPNIACVLLGLILFRRARFK